MDTRIVELWLGNTENSIRNLYYFVENIFCIYFHPLSFEFRKKFSSYRDTLFCGFFVKIASTLLTVKREKKILNFPLLNYIYIHKETLDFNIRLATVFFFSFATFRGLKLVTYLHFFIQYTCLHRSFQRIFIFSFILFITYTHKEF